MGVKISALPASILTDVTYDDVIPIVDLAGPTTQKVTLDLLRQSLFTGTSYTAVVLAGVTTITYSLSVISTTALATPSALAATTAQMFASTVSGGVLMGYGTTHDVALKNRAGTTVIGVTSNTTGVTMAGALAMTGALSGVTTLAASGKITSTLGNDQQLYVSQSATTGYQYLSIANTSGSLNIGLDNSAGTGLITGGVAYASAFYTGTATALILGTNGTARLTIASGGGATFASTLAVSGALTVNAACQLGTAAGTDVITIGGTAYGAGVASVRFNGLTTATTNNLVGTLTNSPVTGNPTFWMPVSIAGVVKYIPCF